jgi:hypothetical protein
MFFLLLAAVMLGNSGAVPRPKCNGALAGVFWPLAANSSSTVRARAATCGELLYCGRNVWRHRWETLAVPYWKLAKQEPPPACRAPLTAPPAAAE